MLRRDDTPGRVRLPRNTRWQTGAVGAGWWAGRGVEATSRGRGRLDPGWSSPLRGPEADGRRVQPQQVRQPAVNMGGCDGPSGLAGLEGFMDLCIIRNPLAYLCSRIEASSRISIL